MDGEGLSGSSPGAALVPGEGAGHGSGPGPVLAGRGWRCAALQGCARGPAPFTAPVPGCLSPQAVGRRTPVEPHASLLGKTQGDGSQLRGEGFPDALLCGQTPSGRTARGSLGAAQH